MIFVGGTAFAAAWLIRGRQSWDLAIIIEVTILIAAIAAHIRGGPAGDAAGPAGGRGRAGGRGCELRIRGQVPRQFVFRPWPPHPAEPLPPQHPTALLPRA